MSSRALRKLQGDSNIISVQDENSDPESDLTSSGGTRKKQLNVNRYDLFNHLSHSESEAKEDDDEEDETETVAGHGVAVADGVGDPSRRKKKKKKKKAIKPLSNQKSSEDNLEVDEVERSVQEVNRILGETPTAGASTFSQSTSSAPRKGILSIEQRFLNPNNELKRIFGSKIVQSEQSKRRARGRGHVRTMWLVAARENWPAVSKQGVSMRLCHSVDGVQYFTFEHSVAYQQVQMRFLRAVNTLNPDNIVAIIHSHPYHVDALLQLSDMCKMSEDLQMAVELNERVLFCLESAFHSSFNLALGSCRLDYARQENRAFFIALFKHLTFVGQRACYRTALEICKVLLSLEPEEDPMAVVLCVDFYALRAGEYAWLARAAQEWEASKNVSQLPNFAFSVAVATLRLAEEAGGDTGEADRLLQNALIMFPSVLKPLLEKCSVQSDARVSAHPFFNILNQVSQRPALRQLVQLYVARGYHVWKESDLLPWLEANVHRVLDRVDAGDPLVAECHEKRLKRYLKPPRPVLRHIVLTDMKEVTAALTEGMDDSILSYDPLPPLNSINLYAPVERSRVHEDSSMFSIFFRSMLPTFNVNERVPEPGAANPAEGNEDRGAEGGAAAGLGAVGEFQRSVVTLVDAVREMLSNIGAHPADADDDADDDDDVDDDDRPHRQ